MKIKTILAVGLAVSILLLATACGLSEQELREQEYIETARGVAESIPLPTFYCPLHGVACEPEEIEVEVLGYSTSTGEPIFEITCKVVCPERGSVLACADESHIFDLLCASKFEVEAGTIYFCSFDAVGISLGELTDDTIEKYWR